MKYFISLLFFIVFTSGCCTERKVKIEDIHTNTGGSVKLASYPSELRGAYLIKGSPNFKYCAEPFSDTSIASSKKLATELATKIKQVPIEASGKVATESLTKIVELQGRTQYVLLAREFLYRTCEAGINKLLTDKQVQKNHQEIMKMITTLITSKKEESIAEQKVIVAQKEKIEAEAAILTLKSKYTDEGDIKYIQKKCKDLSFNDCIKQYGKILNIPNRISGD